MASLRLNQKGESFVMVMLAVSVVLVAGLTAIYFPKITRQSSRIMSSDSCTIRANEVLSALTANSNKINVSSWHPGPGDLAPPAFSHGQPRLGASLGPIMPAAGVADATNVNAWVLVDASYNWLAQKYNDDNGSLCTGNGIQLVPGATVPDYWFETPFKISTTSQLKDEKIFLKLERLDTLTQQPDCNRPVKMIPTNTSNQLAGAKTSLRATVEIQWMDNGTQKKCSANALIKPDSDRTAPFLQPTAQLVANALLNPAPGSCGNPNAGLMVPQYCDCQNGICAASPCMPGNNNCQVFGGRNVKQMIYNLGGNIPTICPDNANVGAVDIGMLSSEPGTIFTCELNSNLGPNTLPPGTGVNFTPCTPLVDPARKTAPTDPSSGIVVRLGNIPLGAHTFSVRAYDSSLNLSGTSTLNFQVMDPCPAWWTVQFCPGPAPSLCGNPVGCNGTKVPTCNDPSTVACGDPVPDDCGGAGGPCGLGLGPALVGPPDNSFIGSRADACGHCTIGGTCIDPMDNPLTPLVDESQPPCPVDNACIPPVIPPWSSCAAQSMNCPTVQVSDSNTPGSFGGGSNNNAGVKYYNFQGGSLANGCTMEYVGATDPNTNQPYGPLPVNLDPVSGSTLPPGGVPGTESGFAFGAGAGDFTGTRDLRLDCGGGDIITCRYQANCAAGACNYNTQQCLP